MKESARLFVNKVLAENASVLWMDALPNNRLEAIQAMYYLNDLFVKGDIDIVFTHEYEAKYPHLAKLPSDFESEKVVVRLKEVVVSDVVRSS